MGKKQFSVAVAATFLSLVHIVVSVPFIMLHGISAECSDHTNSNFPRLLSNLSGSRGSCVEIGNGKSDSWLMPLTKQVEIVCDKVKQMKELRLGYNIVARSQGNLVARGLIEFCDDGPPVYNYVSLAGPHAGESSVPFCGCYEWCDIADKLMEKNIYSDFVQDHLAPSGYIKIPTDISEYMKSSKYLPKLNNEIPNERNSTYKERFTRLKNLVLIMFQNDTVIVPKESSWFGFYQDGNYTSQPPLLSAQQTKLYTEDWIGLKTLDVAGKVKFVSLPGGHLQIATTDVIKYVVPYLQNQPS
ncbi:unnamed protein product [Arabidopsis lyrata]|uniref:palmitoyl-protein thioesterase 3 isoform X1 n=2 Tax=Arabidopsis lyrata subsp. lyrata TaxID=81972 RepID=UPI000A29A343|nr:palmitoyl-protein thioesterase 3 isoform X1 [Arabidopsis lyrata subsp. lyrata]CAH8267158.1 unnamed protein product [Arabidopsis lyrata]|eukprot:XP_020881600.1 palmitoyl-protein thioesterase 3 isoform X1 [Arabidopsis lyrata subsp. lyrata]